MKSFILTTLLALATATIASPVPEAEAEADIQIVSVEARGAPIGAPIPGTFTMWRDTGFSGKILQFSNLHKGVCSDVPVDWNDQISSAGPTSDVTCTLYEDYSCLGRRVTLKYPGSSDLGKLNFNDKASSVLCT